MAFQLYFGNQESEAGMLTPISTSLANVTEPVQGTYSFTNQDGSSTPALTLEQIDAIVDKVQADPDYAMEVLIAYWRRNGGADNPDMHNGIQYVANLGAATPLLIDTGA